MAKGVAAKLVAQRMKTKKPAFAPTGAPGQPGHGLKPYAEATPAERKRERELERKTGYAA